VAERKDANHAKESLARLVKALKHLKNVCNFNATGSLAIAITYACTARGEFGIFHDWSDLPEEQLRQLLALIQRCRAKASARIIAAARQRTFSLN
jgi:hypothetical protein